MNGSFGHTLASTPTNFTIAATTPAATLNFTAGGALALHVGLYDVLGQQYNATLADANNMSLVDLAARSQAGRAHVLVRG